VLEIGESTGNILWNQRNLFGTDGLPNSRFIFIYFLLIEFLREGKQKENLMILFLGERWVDLMDLMTVVPFLPKFLLLLF